MDLHIDPNRGPHAAADLPDETLRRLVDIVLWELAVRTDAGDYRRRLQDAISARDGSEVLLDRVRWQRELICFAREVMDDLRALPTIEEDAGAQPTGMYL